MLLMGGSRRLLIVLLAGLMFSIGGAAVIKRNEKFIENPMLTAAVIPTTTSSTIAPPPTTLVAPAPRPAKPVKNPGSYAAEPVVEIGTIEIPKIGLTSRIMHGITMRNIDHGPSHWPGTAFPGENGNAVFAGHRVTKTRPFNRLDELQVGDIVIFHIQGQKSTYAMTGSEIVTPDALRIINPTATATATLFACHPKGSAKQRIVAYFSLVETVAE